MPLTPSTSPFLISDSMTFPNRLVGLAYTSFLSPASFIPLKRWWSHTMHAQCRSSGNAGHVRTSILAVVGQSYFPGFRRGVTCTLHAVGRPHPFLLLVPFFLASIADSFCSFMASRNIKEAKQNQQKGRLEQQHVPARDPMSRVKSLMKASIIVGLASFG